MIQKKDQLFIEILIESKFKELEDKFNKKFNSINSNISQEDISLDLKSKTVIRLLTEKFKKAKYKYIDPGLGNVLFVRPLKEVKPEYEELKTERVQINEDEYTEWDHGSLEYIKVHTFTSVDKVFVREIYEKDSFISSLKKILDAETRIKNYYITKNLGTGSFSDQKVIDFESNLDCYTVIFNVQED